MPKKNWRGLPIISRTRWRGFSEASGFCNTSCESRRIIGKRASVPTAISRFSNVSFPPEGTCNPATVRVIVDLPLPDSPTRANVSLGLMSNVILRTTGLPTRLANGLRRANSYEISNWSALKIGSADEGGSMRRTVANLGAFRCQRRDFEHSAARNAMSGCNLPEHLRFFKIHWFGKVTARSKTAARWQACHAARAHARAQSVPEAARSILAQMRSARGIRVTRIAK